MAFRDETEALRARITVLEGELAAVQQDLDRLPELERERDQLRARVDQLEDQLGIRQDLERARAAERAREAAEEREAQQARQIDAQVERVRARQREHERRDGAREAQRVKSTAFITGNHLKLAGVALGIAAAGYGLSTLTCTSVRSGVAPSVGVIDLDRSPEPAAVAVLAEGDRPSSGDCAGFVPTAPQIVLRSTRPMQVLFDVTGDGTDLVMSVLTSDGRVLCDDDSGDAMAPRITAVVPAGETRIWVGTYQPDNTSRATLAVRARAVDATPDETGLASSAAPTLGTMEGPDAAESFGGVVEPMVRASTIESRCAGTLPVSPQLVVRALRASALVVEARGNDDLVLLVRAPDGTIQCDDDSGPGNAPRITVAAQPGEHRVWVGQYSGSSERVAVEVSARLTRVDPTLGPLLGVRELGAPGSEVLVEGTSSGELGPSALGARCDGGLIPARPHVVVHTSTAVDVVLSTVGAGTGRPPFLLIRDPDGALRCVTDPLGRQAWAAGDHAIYVGVRDEDEAGRFSLRLRSEVSSLDTW